MIHPKPNNKINNNTLSNFGLTLGQVLYGDPVITTLSNVIEKYNPIVPQSQVNNSSNNNIQNKQNNQNKQNKQNKQQANPNDNLSSNSSSSSTYTTDLAESSESKSESSSNNSSSSSIGSPSETKFYWEYGNTGLKIKEFKKKMSRNLSIMYYVDRLFNEYIDTILTNTYSKLYSSSSNSNYKLKTGNIKSYRGKVSATISHKKLNGTFNVLEAGFMTISDIKLTDKDLKNNSIPNLDSILSHKDNIYHITKIIKLFNLHTKMTVKSNLSNKNMNLENITSTANSYVTDLVKNKKKKRILRATRHSGFYIKMYNNHGKGFIIDSAHNIIYYIAVNINFKSSSINLRYYAFEIIDGKINKI